MMIRLLWVGAALALATCPAAFAAVDKHAAHARMVELEAQVAALKSQPAQRQAFVSAQSELQAISASLGGDLPCAKAPPQAAATATPKGAGGTVPPAPTGCTPTTTDFTNATPVAVPTGPAVVTSEIVVTGAGAFLWDVNLTTFLAHTFSADLDVTITSPEGTVVTLTTDNGGNNDNVFNGTVWDDSANPAGQVPYASNNGLVTDHVYANLTAASPLVPEEALAAFVGEDPNGTWTITVSDDLAGDGGSLDGWTLSVTTFTGAPNVSAPVTFVQATPTPLADNAVTTATLEVTGLPAPVCNAVLRTNLPHSFPADLDITLTSPAGTVVTLTTDNAGTNDNVFAGTEWRDDADPLGQVPYVNNDGLVTDRVYAIGVLATPLVPEESMGAFLGQDGNGTWTLTVSDDTAADQGTIERWELEFQTCTCQLADLSVSVLDTPDPVPANSELAYAITLANAGPDDAVALAYDTATPAGTTFVSLAAPPELTCTVPAVGSTGAVSCTSATPLAAGSDYALTLVVAVAESAIDGSTLTLASAVTSSTSDGDLANNEVETTTTVTTQADVGVTLVDTPDPVTAGSDLVYALALTNGGPAAAYDVEVALPLPAGTTFTAVAATAGSPSCTVPAVGSNGTVTCTLAGSSPIGAVFSVDVTATVAPGTAPGTVLSAMAIASSSSPDPDPANEAATADTTVVAAQADLAISKDDGSTTAAPGGSSVYTIVASNLGSTAVAGATVTDTLPAGLTCTWTAAFAGGATGTAAGSGSLAESVDLPVGGTATYTLDCDVAIDAVGSIANTASIAPPSGIVDPTAGNDSDTDTNALDGEADLSVVITADTSTVAAGGAVTYTVVVANAGPSNVTDAAFVANEPDGLTCNWSAAYAGGASGPAAGVIDIDATLVLPAGGTATFTIDCLATSSAELGVIANTASVSSAATADPMEANNTDSVDITFTGSVDLWGYKTVNAADTYSPGDTVTYTIELVNQGLLAQGDNPGDEFVDVLPDGLTGVSATATSGTAVLAGNTVTWNGAIPGEDGVTITITATIDADAEGEIVNHATLNFDADGDGTNEATAMSDNPDTKETQDPTGFEVAPGTVEPPVPSQPAVIPAADAWALAALALLLLGLGWRRRLG